MVSRFATLPAELLTDLAQCGLSPEPEKASYPQGPGAYLLVINLKKPLNLDLPRLAASPLAAGWYAYAGSACGPGGLKARIERHRRKAKRRHWHIDRLTCRVRPYAIAIPDGHECAIVDALTGHGAFETPVPGFGSSDCRTCASHLMLWKP